MPESTGQTIISSEAEADVSVSKAEDVGLLAVRGNLSDPEFVSSFESATGSPPPGKPFSSFVNTELSIFWLSPDCWLISCDIEQTPGLQTRLDAALFDRHASVTLISDSMKRIRVEGRRSVDLMMRCGTIDFDGDSFKPGEVRRARFGDTTAVYHRPEATLIRYDLYVPRSYSDYSQILLAQLSLGL